MKRARWIAGGLALAAAGAAGLAATRRPARPAAYRTVAVERGRVTRRAGPPPAPGGV